MLICVNGFLFHGISPNTLLIEEGGSVHWCMYGTSVLVEEINYNGIKESGWISICETIQFGAELIL